MTLLNRRSKQQLEGDGTAQAIIIPERALIERVLVKGTGTVTLQSVELPATNEELLIPVKSSETLTFNAASGNFVTVVFVELER